MDSYSVDSDYGKIGICGEGPESILFVGGWNQSPERMLEVQRTLGEYGLSSIGISPFDNGLNLNMDQKLPDVSELTTIQESILRRAALLNEAAATLPVDVFGQSPSKVLTHCGGANVYLLALHIDQNTQLPKSGVLAEPMIAENMNLNDYTRPAVRHQRAYEKGDLRRINFRALAPQDADFDASRSKETLTSILNSRGATLLAEALSLGARLKLLLGHDDFAAPESAIESSLANQALNPAEYIHRYRPNKLGHGYLLAEPKEAVADIVPLLDSL